MSRPTGGLWNNKLVFNGTELGEEFNAIIVPGRTLNAPTRTYTRVNIPAKNGVMYIDEGTFGNVTQTYTFIFPENFYANYNNLKSYLLGVSNYAWLNERFPSAGLSYAYWMQARVTNIVPTYDRDITYGYATVTFDRLPQRWDINGNPLLDPASFVPVVNQQTLINPYSTNARPVIRVVGTGWFLVAPYGDDPAKYSFEVRNHPTETIPYIDIDSETMECYCEDENCNQYVSIRGGLFPLLEPGDNIAVVPATMTVTISPRWWSL